MRKNKERYKQLIIYADSQSDINSDEAFAEDSDKKKLSYGFLMRLYRLCLHMCYRKIDIHEGIENGKKPNKIKKKNRQTLSI